MVIFESENVVLNSVSRLEKCTLPAVARDDYYTRNSEHVLN